ncbi:MAG TPA: GIY-YIG nuclease family protein, partial [Nitrospirae bacterium]|nr:GIY-YIG nuclease family protein [Nitrospirota bacterium]
MVSLSNHGSYYTGVTNDVERRFYEHQEGLIEGCYTHDKRPLKLMHVEEFTDIIEAISREKQIKGWSRRKKEAIIAGDYEELVKLSKSHPSTEPALSGTARKGEPFDRACPERKETERRTLRQAQGDKKRQAWNN